MKGIVLAGGSGTRLWPLTLEISKQILPIYDKPMIYYPISTLMEMKIKEILIISTPKDTEKFRQLFDDGSRIGVKFSYVIQKEPKGIAQALILAEDFLEGDACTLILGDNLFFGPEFVKSTIKASFAIKQRGGCCLFGYDVPDPERFGVAEIGKDNRVIEIIEKPEYPKSNLAVTGIYIYDGNASINAKKLMPSDRGEIEITDLNMTYVKDQNAQIEIIDSNCVWLDTGTPDSLQEASIFVKEYQNSTGKKVACLEEIAFKNGFIDRVGLISSVERYPTGNLYGDYIRSLLD